ncbi:hypothetical protein [Saccharopolyspora pogona]|uniref:hypothetical protein n=1 Tax=Saccharopolyspora pogona TaxID=333966 RepID=UPI0016885A79|nr:hypothetical protein [Saccharopolyspora pogona]
MSSRKCIGKKTDGEPCGRWAVKGATVCPSHGGNAPQVRRRAAVRAELESWGLDAETVDPGETLLRLLSQAAARADRYAAAVQRLVDEQGLEAALVGDTLVVDQEGNTRKVGEYVRGLAQLEAQERDRAAKFSHLAIQAGLAERQVRLAERQTSLVEKALLATLEDLGMSDDQQQQAFGRLAHHLRLIA